MIRTGSLYQTCDKLFAGYPLAAGAAGRDGSRSMVLLLRHGGDVRFFVLSRADGEDRPSYVLRPWPAGDAMDIEADGGAAVTHGVPIPRHGALFGWMDGDTVTALVAVYARYTPVSPEPCWATMPRTGVPEAQWPPFTDERFFGPWFWEHFRAGRIILLAGLIGATSGTVYWVDTKAVLGSDCCAVAREVRSPEGPVLPRGRYVYYQALRLGKRVPPLKALLAETGKIDLAPRFRRPV